MQSHTAFLFYVRLETRYIRHIGNKKKELSRAVYAGEFQSDFILPPFHTKSPFGKKCIFLTP